MHTQKGDAQRCVIIPSYNSGALLRATVLSVLNFWRPVIVVVDGSTDQSDSFLMSLAEREKALHVLRLDKNHGKGGAVLAGLELAAGLGMTHAAVFDSDGQHEAGDLPKFMKASVLYPDAMILGAPIFGPDAPTIRVVGRKVGNWWTNLETLWGGIEDSLFGFRVYPVEPSLEILRSIKGARRFDFDTQLAVRLYWDGVRVLNLKTRVCYKLASFGGVTHFQYLRDNLLLINAHAGLILGALTRLPLLLRLRQRSPLEIA